MPKRRANKGDIWLQRYEKLRTAHRELGDIYYGYSERDVPAAFNTIINRIHVLLYKAEEIATREYGIERRKAAVK